MIRKLYMKLYRGAGIGFFAIAVTWLFLMSIFATCYFVAPTERTAFKKDNIWLNIIGLVLFLILTYKIYKNEKICKWAKCIQTNETQYRKIKRILLCIYGILSIFFVLGTQYMPRADQQSVLDAAYQLKMGNFDLWKKGGYMEMYPNQNGIVLIIYLFSFLVGDNNYIAFQLLNAVVLVILMKQLMDISGILGASKAGQLVVGVIQIIYCPLIFYTFFVYGNIIGLSLSLFAMREEWKFFQSKKKVHIFYSSIAIALAVMIKNNYLIFMLSMLFYAFGEAIGKKQWKFMLICVGILLAFIGQKKLTQFTLEHMTKIEINGGASSLAWVAMGLQEGGYLPDGWYNRYILTSYEQSGYDKEVQAEMSKKEIQNRLRFFKENPEQIQKFLYRKTASEWNNPSFQGMCIIQECETKIVPNSVSSWALSGKGSYYLTVFWSYIQGAILFGTLLYVILGGYKNEKSLVFIVTFVGGFLFHMLWEAKSQYTISYFVLLIPLAVTGMEKVCFWIKNIKKNGKQLVQNKKLRIKCVVILAGILFVTTVPGIRRLYKPSSDIINYATYEKEMLQYTPKKN